MRIENYIFDQNDWIPVTNLGSNCLTSTNPEKILHIEKTLL